MTLAVRRFSITRRAFAAIAITLIALLGIGGAGQASNEDGQAGLVVYFDSDAIEYYLFSLPDESIDGYEFLEMTGLELEVQPFGGLGEAVCAIGGTGCPGSDCFCESYSSPAYFWQYFLYDGVQWVPQHQGARSHSVQPGEIVAWAWTAGPPDLPETSIDELKSIAEADDDSDQRETPVTTETPSGHSDEVDPGEDSEPGAEDITDDAASGSSRGSTQCASFLGLSALIFGLTRLISIRRYRDATVQ